MSDKPLSEKRKAYDESRRIATSEKKRASQQVLMRIIEILHDADSYFSHPSPLHKHIHTDFVDLIAWHARYGTLPE